MISPSVVIFLSFFFFTKDAEEVYGVMRTRYLKTPGENSRLRETPGGVTFRVVFGNWSLE